MKPRELFAVGVKGVGLFFIVQGIYRLLEIVDVIVPLVTTDERLDSQSRAHIGGFIFAAVLYFAISAFFLRSDWLVGIAFPKETGGSNSGTDGNRAA
jgi:hypothetical protein